MMKEKSQCKSVAKKEKANRITGFTRKIVNNSIIKKKSFLVSASLWQKKKNKRGKNDEESLYLQKLWKSYERC